MDPLVDAHAHAPEFKELIPRYVESNLAGDFADISQNYVQRPRSAYLVAVSGDKVVGGVGLHPVEVADNDYAQTLSEADRETTAELRRWLTSAFVYDFPFPLGES